MTSNSRQLHFLFVKAKKDLEGKIKEDTTLDSLDISNRSLNCLHRAGVQTVKDFFDYNPYGIGKIRNFGKTCMLDVIENGLRPAAEDNQWEKRALIAEETIKELKEIILEGLCYDGAHHKQYYLHEAAKLLGIPEEETKEFEEGIPA